MMTGDIELGKKCNVRFLEDNEMRDLYMEVAEKLQSKLSIAAKKKEIRKAVKAIAVKYVYGAGVIKINDKLKKDEDKSLGLCEMSDEDRKAFIKDAIETINEVVPSIKIVKNHLQKAVREAVKQGQDRFEWETLSGFHVEVRPLAFD